jgi:transketolase
MTPGVGVDATRGLDPTELDLDRVARQLRREIIKAVALARAGHLGGPLSCADILTALYFRVMNVRESEPAWPDRDRFILSKGHSSIALYAALALRGYFSVDELATFDAIDSRLQGHPDMTALPGLDMSTGSLGLGFAASVGVALGAKLGRLGFTTYTLLGDGECNEGVVWEAAEIARRYGLDNLISIIDYNGLQQFGWRDETTGGRQTPYVGDALPRRWQAFGWEVIEVDGHNIREICGALEQAKTTRGSPTAVIARTVKGKGVSFMEGDFRWHSRVPSEQELVTALAELADPDSENLRQQNDS